MALDAPVVPPVVGLSLEGPRSQRRVTVAFRIILAFPHLLWLGVLTFVTELAVFVGWFAAVFTGRLPAGIAEFVTKVLRYSARVYGYQYLLTDTYPPFDLDAEGYAVELDVPPPGRLNRAAVLFRLILLVPAGILATLVGVGLFIAMVFIWLIVLIAGRMPRSVFEALSAVLRYQLRLAAFAAMLTSEYPKRLFGDKGLAADATPVEAPAPEPLAPELFAAPPPIVDVTAPPRITRLVLSKAGKRIVALFIVIGALAYGGGIVAGVIAGSQSSRALDAFARYDNQVGDDSLRYGRDVQACAINGGIPCLQQANLRFADAVDRFREQMRSIDLPAAALADGNRLDEDSAKVSALLRELGRENDPAAYQDGFSRLQALVLQVTDDERALEQTLRRSP